MRIQSPMNEKGVTLIELLIVMVIAVLLVGGIYRLFIAQSKAYAVQDQVVEVQQNIRIAMEILLRDLRMAGFDDDRTPGTVISIPLVAGDHTFTVSYEHNNARREVSYWVDGTSRLMRQETENGASVTAALVEDVDAFTLAYGVDYDAFGNEDGAVDYWEHSSGNVGSRKVVAVRVSLSARPAQVNPDLQNIAPRTLASSVTIRNLSFR
jgi:prepilin-type N-terminal cleavage/methylation domain-containing protein